MRKKSLKKQIAATLGILAVVFILLALALGYTYFRFGVDKQQREVQTLSEQYKNLLNRSLSQAKSHVDNYFTVSPDYNKIASGPTFDYEWVKGVYHIKADLTAMAGTLSAPGGFFFYDRSRDSFFSAFHEIDGDLIALNSHIKNQSRTIFTDKIYYGFEKYEGDIFLVYYISLNGCPIGYSMKLSEFIPEEEGREFYFYLRSEEEQPDITILDTNNSDIIAEARLMRMIEDGNNTNIFNRIVSVSNQISEFPGLHMVSVYQMERGFPGFEEGRWVLFILVIIALLLEYVYLLRILRTTLYTPIEHLKNRLSSKKKQDAGVPEKENEIEEYADINRQVDAMIQQITFLREEQLNEQLRTKEAILQYYQAQTDPHFFLSCLNTISSLLENKRVDAADRLIMALSSHFRYMFRGNKTMVNVSEEIEAVRHYCEIYQMRLGFPIFVSVDMEKETETFQIPLLTIMTFVENAVKHSRNRSKVLSLKITVSSVKDDDRNGINIRIMDNGAGYPEEALKKLNSTAEDYKYLSEHIGIDNLKYRLNLLLGSHVNWYFYNSPYGGAVGEITILEAGNERTDY